MPGSGQRQDHVAERLARRGAEIGGRLDQIERGTRSSAACIGRIMKGSQI